MSWHLLKSDFTIPDESLCWMPGLIYLALNPNEFFMVQEMEAWFLKQPNCFEKWAKLEKYNKRDEKSISDHNLISGKNIEDISKPSAVVDILLKHFFEKRIDGKKRKLAVYGKLRTAPVLLDCLDVALLETQDSELVRFKNIMNKNFIMKL